MVLDELIRLPSYHVPDGVMFGYPTRLIDSWTPEIERVWVPGHDRVGPAVIVRAFEGESGELAYGLRLRNPLRKLARKLARVRILSGDFAFDSRWTYEGNMAHVLENIAASAIFAQRVLRARLGGDRRVVVIVRRNAAAMALRVLELLNIPVIATDSGLEGQIVEVFAPREPGREPEPIGSGILQPAYPRLFDQLFPGYDANTPEKVFISRRSSRVLTNEEPIWDLLRRRGFVRYYFEDLPIESQWSIVANARELVSIHGGALGALVHRHGVRATRGVPTTLRLTELFGAGYLVEMYRNHLAVLGGRWVAARGQITPEIIRDLDLRGQARSHQGDSFAIDPGALAQALDFDDERFPAVPPLDANLDWLDAIRT